MADEIDFLPYSRPPRLDATGGLAVARRLIKACPTAGFPSARKKVPAVREAALALQTEAKLRARTRPANMKPIDSALDTAWSAVRDRIAPWTWTTDAKLDAQRRLAAKMLASYFPDGVEFVKLAYEQQWVESEQLLQRIKEEGARDVLEELAGKPFLANLESAHAAYGDALDLGDEAAPKTAASPTGIAERVGKLSRAIFDYTRALAGDVDLGDPSSVAAFRDAVAPLDAYRARLSGGLEQDPETPLDAIPPLPDADPEELVTSARPGFPGGPALEPEKPEKPANPEKKG